MFSKIYAFFLIWALWSLKLLLWFVSKVQAFLLCILCFSHFFLNKIWKKCLLDKVFLVELGMVCSVV